VQAVQSFVGAPRAARTEIGVPVVAPHDLVAPVHNLAATVVDPPLLAPSGAYRIVNPGDSVETVRARMIQMGLDPNARQSIIPQPPPRRAPEAAQAGHRQATRQQPNAIVRGR
jgi:hypothetical protein